MAYFIRYTGNPKADLERGHSFVGYCLWNTKEEALQNLAQYDRNFDNDNFDFETWAEENDYLVAQDNTTGMWGTPRSGLCGFGSFDSVEEAVENIELNQYHATEFCAIFEGKQTYDQELDGLDDGITFRPVSIAKILTFNTETQNYE